MLVISGISKQKNKDVIELLQIVAQSKADIKIFEENQVDVAHWISRGEAVPIIINFVTYIDRKITKRKKITTPYSKLNRSLCRLHRRSEEATINSNIYINKSLTVYNKSLLKERQGRYVGIYIISLPDTT